MRHRTAVAALAIAAVLALTACGNLTTEDGTQSVNSETSYKLKDGRTVICIYGRFRLSCDWEHAK